MKQETFSDLVKGIDMSVYHPLEDSVELSDMEIKEMFTVFYFKDI